MAEIREAALSIWAEGVARPLDGRENHPLALSRQCQSVCFLETAFHCSLALWTLPFSPRGSKTVFKPTSLDFSRLFPKASSSPFCSKILLYPLSCFSHRAEAHRQQRALVISSLQQVQSSFFVHKSPWCLPATLGAGFPTKHVCPEHRSEILSV